jgi:thiamine-monophosphate kinase
VTRSGEFEWIARYLAPLSIEGSFGLLDDAALLDVADLDSLVVTQDVIAQGVHFLPDDPVDLVARKALRVNISDIISKGATPVSYSLALGVPDIWQDDDMQCFAQGLAEDQETYGLGLTGGDTYRSSNGLCVGVTMFGTVKKQGYKSRFGAKVGDALVVTGTIGDAALGLKVASGALDVPAAMRQHFIDAYRLPNPPVKVAELVSRLASAAMDISDGLLGDCRKLCSASGVSASLNLDAVPLSHQVEKTLANDASYWSSVLVGGDDYQILCSVDRQNVAIFQRQVAELGLIATAIGVITSEKVGVVTLDKNGIEVSIENDSYSHF